MHPDESEDDQSELNRTLSTSELADPAFMSKADAKRDRFSGQGILPTS